MENKVKIFGITFQKTIHDWKNNFDKPINASATDGWKLIRHCLLDESLF